MAGPSGQRTEPASQRRARRCKWPPPAASGSPAPAPLIALSTSAVCGAVDATGASRSPDARRTMATNTSSPARHAPRASYCMLASRPSARLCPLGPNRASGGHRSHRSTSRGSKTNIAEAQRAAQWQRIISGRSVAARASQVPPNWPLVSEHSLGAGAGHFGGLAALAPARRPLCSPAQVSSGQ